VPDLRRENEAGIELPEPTATLRADRDFLMEMRKELDMEEAKNGRLTSEGEKRERLR
jgi:hypothetical protein